MAKPVMEKTAAEKRQEEMLNILDRLGDDRHKDETIKFGTGWTAPNIYENDLRGAAADFNRQVEELEEDTTFTRSFQYRPWDGAVAVTDLFTQKFGMSPRSIKSFFNVPEMRSIPVGPGRNDIRQVMWGKVAIPLFDGIMRLGSEGDAAVGFKFRVQISTKKKNKDRVETLFMLIQKQLDESSIYRGKVIDGSDIPNFLDTSKINPDELVFNDTTERQIMANLIVPVKHPEIHDIMRLGRKRVTLASGGYGVGKTETIKMVSKVCDDVGRTCIVVSPKEKNDVISSINMAAMYQPSTVLIEDIDTLSDEPLAVSEILDVFGGYASAGMDMTMLLTTNHPKKINQGLLRAGRIDTHILYTNLDREPAERLIRLQFPDTVDRVDFDQVYEKISDFAPSFVVEMTKKVRLYLAERVIRQQGPEAINELGKYEYETLDFLSAAEQTASHHRLHLEGAATAKRPTVDQAIENAMVEAQKKLEGTIHGEESPPKITFLEKGAQEDASTSF